MEIRIMTHGMINDLIDVFRGVVFQADNRRSQYANPVRLQPSNQRTRVNTFQLVIFAVFAFDPQPDPGQSQSHQLFNGIGFQNPGRAENEQ